ncbi:META domain-containing protein [Brumimicrobium aurantiacum]|uniref:META domain-containing protein n=1 Tax=Brumimicrobium aurantiacum TaxID=1737063 RepID=A0A3E1EWE3_9FLAO|nr:META domain-containing protein [Brumimicrobium aurantiacum]RFC53813.1 META domain-containing protein [Brumimicrobium aurantiacum]
MKMKKLTYALFACVLMTLSSCGNTKETEVIKADHQNISSVDFYAENSDENWKLSVTFDGKIVFTDTQNKISFVADSNTRQIAQGADIVNIFAQNATQIFRASIDIADCEKNGKRVNIMLRKSDQKEGYDYSGCGFYRGKPQLHDIWALEQLNGEKVTTDHFPKERPHFEFNLSTNKMSGFAGCNQVNGSLAFEYNRMIIEPLASTRMFCGEATELENTILEIFKSKPIYSHEGLYLTIESPKGSIKLKKID